MFQGLFELESAYVISIADFMLCVGAAVLCGLILGLCSRIRMHSSKSFTGTLALLPAVVCIIIMMVNGNIGAGVAVAGAFSLVRFRSMPGTAREIGLLFLAMGTGLICGMGYLAYAVLTALLLGGISVLYHVCNFGPDRASRVLNVTIPEDLDYTEVLDDLLRTYTRRYELESVKTTNMGSLFRLTYFVTLKDASKEKELIDALRCRNGNLEITLSKPGFGANEL